MGRFFACLLIAASIGTPQATFAELATPRVVVTVEPLKPYVDDILKGVTESTSLMKAGQDPHTAALTPSQAQALKEADIIVMPSQSMAPKLIRVLAKKKKEGAVIVELTALPGADAMPLPKQNPWLELKKAQLKDTHAEDTHVHADETHVHDEHGQHEEDEKKGTMASADTKKEPIFDPHIWLDPLRMAAIAVPLAETLSTHAPNYRETFRANARVLDRHLRMEVNPGIQAMLKARTNNAPFGNKPFMPFLTYHASYQYFLSRYKLDEAGFILNQPEETLGAKSMHARLQGAEAINLRCLISETGGAMVNRIADVSGARVVMLNPERGYETGEVGLVSWAKNDYERLLYKVAEGFAGCL